MLRFCCFLLFANGVLSSPATELDPIEATVTEFQLSVFDLQDLFDERVAATKEAYLNLRFEEKVNRYAHAQKLVLILKLFSWCI